ncbi:MAG TPA: hypothetical protein VMF86_03660, partial [Stellaceae bacterium]|nr:hypothetical protein [Stellaceae bacterium]
KLPILFEAKREGRRLAEYRVCFLNKFSRNERIYKCCQRSIVIRLAPNPEQAVEAAKKEFARLEGIRDRRIHAAYIEVEAIEDDADRSGSSSINEESSR